MNLKAAKPCKYNGIEFRSQEEARWAIFFDHNPVVTSWQYEPATFEWENQEYTPDFVVEIMSLQFLFEAKPLDITPTYTAKLVEFATKIAKCEVVVGIGSWFAKKPYPQIRTSADNFRTLYPLEKHLVGQGKIEKVAPIVQGTRFDVEGGLPVSPRIAKPGAFEEIRKRWRARAVEELKKKPLSSPKKPRRPRQ